MVKKWLLAQMADKNSEEKKNAVEKQPTAKIDFNRNKEEYEAGEKKKGRKKRKRNINMQRDVKKSPWLTFCQKYREVVQAEKEDAEKDKRTDTTATFRLEHTLPERTTIMAKSYSKFREMVAHELAGERPVTSQQHLEQIGNWKWTFDAGVEGNMKWE